MKKQTTACKHCSSVTVVRNGHQQKSQRFLCRHCGKTFQRKPPRYHDAAIKQKALEMYLNNVGIRKIALFLGVSPPAVLKWVRGAADHLAIRLRTMADQLERSDNTPDIIEMDEIYTYVQKNSSARSSGLLILDSKAVLLRLK
jgi:transposase-like protein